MFAARRSAPSTRQLLRTQRRWGSHAAHEPVNEGLGRSFYVTSGTIASAFVLYHISKSIKESGEASWMTGLINKWTPSQEVFEQRNAIHTAIMDKAAFDRHLLGSQGPAEAFAHRQPEMLNAGSPFNVSPGSQADLSHVVAHYQRKNQEIEESRVARTKDGKVVSLYD
ncbi:hypothetical protein DTO013E5_489 [Penicillium roqueforti]|uniref:Genomic scaffold, ProqFM164S02 n=1 Tax=Penicillium roqueforti (strain FM164) TaxID=1365484 RepID=W6Q9K1_PENRF|nr:uncharacterized protein LCP9604111_649 [Penicillium roqueforti]CDM30864.1 unnamed protein product [Penicillium roqueforti FM164]KAF9253123.1 hypothetical protein LCP9604111_649 [Penicillium roqueforti]KAI1838639.1 hypothetical protein CBS147337_364 [Penicillium roqueforti]KAI2680460.1 hypothetical protein CBS147355_3440 [Penicillium roqueforti]KAI2691151.1 hypothetical protein LCP963914a_1352 [Penicillium roqueforti]